MKIFPALRYLPQNIELTEINGVFRSKNLFKNKRIYIGVEWKNGKHSSIPIEMANHLALGRKYSGKDIAHEVPYERVIVTILRQDNIDKSSGHYQYIFQTDKGAISVSGFELARTIFFHNRHIVNAAYTPNGLSELAYVDISTSPTTIRFPESTKYPVSYLKTKRTMGHLAWLFLDNEARNSFFTIYQCFQNNIDSIAFNFIPPNLTGWQLELSVIKKPRYELLQVKRIEKILDARVSKKYSGVKFCHPKQRQGDKSGGERQEKPHKTPSVDINPELDMGEIPGLGKRLHIHKSNGFSFNVSGIQGVFLSDGNKPYKPKFGVDVDQQVEPEIAGLGPPVHEGRSQEFDPVINQDNDSVEETDDLPQKFLIFEQVVKNLIRRQLTCLVGVN